MNTYTYIINDGIYINLTNQCSNDCKFCIRNTHDGIEGYHLWLENVPTAEQIILELEGYGIKNYKEVVFCGFGEPTYCFDAIKTISDYVHRQGGKTRINTNGQAKLILGRDITKEIGRYIDVINVSLNATNPAKYQEICKSCYGEGAYHAMIEFAEGCVGHCSEVILSVVDCIGKEEIEKAKTIAKRIGAKLRVREEI